VTNEKYTTRLTVIVFVLMAIIGGIGFTLSYEALMAVAQSHGKAGWLGVLWPLIIDAPIVAFSLAAVIATAKHRSPMTPRAVVILATVATIAYNWFHAYTPGVDVTSNAVAVSVAVMAPVMYFLSFEVSLWLIGIVTDVTEPDKTVTRPALQPDKAVTNVTPAPDKTVTNVTLPDLSHYDKEQRQAALPEYKHLSRDELSSMFGVSLATISRDRRELNGAMK